MKTALRFHQQLLRPGVILKALLWSILLQATAAATAQQVLVPPPTPPKGQQPPFWEAMPTNETATVSETNQTEAVFTGAPAGAATIPSGQQPFKWGSIVLHPHLAYSFTYGNGIHSQPGQQRKTITQGVSPGFGMDLGHHWRLDYTPTARFYSDSHFRNTVDHAVSLSGGTIYRDWTLGVSQRCALTSQPRIETASQTDQQLYSTALNATYQINTPLSLELSAAQNLRYVGGFTNILGSSIGNSRTWSTLDWLNFQWGPTLSTAGGIGFGYTAVDVGSDMTHEQLQGRAMWRVVQKIYVSVSGGAEIRQFLNSGQPDLVTPIFGAAVSCQPFGQTTLSLAANRSVNSSYYQNQVTENTSVIASIRQRLLGRFFLTLSGGYANASYLASTRGIQANREDNYNFFRVDLSTAFLKRGTASVFYSTSKNSSNTGGFGYNSDQVGFELAYKY